MFTSGIAYSLINLSESQNPGIEYHSYDFKNTPLGLLVFAPHPPSLRPLLSWKALWWHGVKPAAATYWILYVALSAPYWEALGPEKVHIIQARQMIHEQEWHGCRHTYTGAPHFGKGWKGPRQRSIKITRDREKASRQWLLIASSNTRIRKHLTKLRSDGFS